MPRPKNLLDVVLVPRILFALGAEDLLPNTARLAGVESGAGITGLLVVARGTGRLTTIPARRSVPVDEPVEVATPSRKLNDSSFAIGDLSLVGDARMPPVSSPSSVMSARMAPTWLSAQGGRRQASQARTRRR
jgi:hypothetical protein